MAVNLRIAYLFELAASKFGKVQVKYWECDNPLFDTPELINESNYEVNDAKTLAYLSELFIYGCVNGHQCRPILEKALNQTKNP